MSGDTARGTYTLSHNLLFKDVLVSPQTK